MATSSYSNAFSMKVSLSQMARCYSGSNSKVILCPHSYILTHFQQKPLPYLLKNVTNIKISKDFLDQVKISTPSDFHQIVLCNYRLFTKIKLPGSLR